MTAVRTSFSKEAQLENPVRGLFPDSHYFVKAEVPFGLKRIDLVFKARRCEKTVAVELKLNDWKRAVWQAVHNRQIATYSYIALPVNRLRAIDLGLLSSLGLGLILANLAEAKILLPARQSECLNRRIARQIALFVERATDV